MDGTTAVGGAGAGRDRPRRHRLALFGPQEVGDPRHGADYNTPPEVHGCAHRPNPSSIALA